ncbi:glycosyltransferase family 2 protein [Halobacterium bonnevillei]|uniref:Glycosyltransferase n=1 Tax=Halobacterium bonnevillei TaxID=2692200 RepID=A0A6B0SIZ6_9EURY|nr:glycosyltransferase family 2 protein [Halobacterium bonnevillei]MXR21718.1 glycosyltransferase [Halobacterium bonnevillei]
MYEGHSIAAVIPAYNEESFIGEVIETLPDFVDRAYVVDDASTDDTWTEIQTHAERVNDAKPAESPVTDGGVELDPRVVPIQHDENRGVGGAIKTGYRAALDDGVDVTLVVSGDGQTEPDILERILEPVAAGEAGYAKGNRLLDQDRDAMPRFRQAGNFVLTFLTKISSGYWGMMDPQNGSTAISREALEAVDIAEMYEDYGYCNDLLARLNAAGVTVADVSRRAVYEDEESHIDYRTYIPKVSVLLLGNFLWRLRSKYLSEQFHPLPLFYYAGAVAAGGGLASLLRRAASSESDGVVESLTLVSVGVLGLIAGMVLDREENRGMTVQKYDQ